MTHTVLPALPSAAAPSLRACHGSTGPNPDSSPGRSASPARVTSGTVRFSRPGTVTPAPATPAPAPAPTTALTSARTSALGLGGRSPASPNRSRNASVRRSPVSAPTPARFSSRARSDSSASIAPATSASSSRAAICAFPESSARNSTCRVFAACSRRRRAFSGATCITARFTAARSAPGVIRPARSRILSSTAAASASSRFAVARWMIRTLSSRNSPRSSAAIVPDSFPARSYPVSTSTSAPHRESASVCATSVAVNSSHNPGSPPGVFASRPGAGRCPMNAATAWYRRPAAYDITRSHAATAPITSSSDAPAYHPSAPAASSRNNASVPHGTAVSSAPPCASAPAAGTSRAPATTSATGTPANQAGTPLSRSSSSSGSHGSTSPPREATHSSSLIGSAVTGSGPRAW